MSSTGFYRDLLQENPDILAKIVLFNAKNRSEAPALSRIPEAWRERLLPYPELRAAWENLERRDTRLEAEPADEGYWSFVAPTERLVFLSADELERLGKMTAASLMAEAIAHTVVKADVNGVKAFLGPDIYRWVLCRGRFLPGSLALDMQSSLSERDLTTQLMLLSRGVLEGVRATWPEALQRRSDALFAGLALAPAQPVPDNDAMRKRVWYLMKKIILQEFDQSWTPFFS